MTAVKDPREGPGRPGEWEGSVVYPGQTCGLCKRRVPHPRTAHSPKSKVSAFRAPADIVQELKDRLSRLSEECGFDKLPYSEARTILLLLTIVEAVSRETLVEVASGMSWGTTPAE